MINEIYKGTEFVNILSEKIYCIPVFYIDLKFLLRLSSKAFFQSFNFRALITIAIRIALEHSGYALLHLDNLHWCLLQNLAMTVSFMKIIRDTRK